MFIFIDFVFLYSFFVKGKIWVKPREALTQVQRFVNALKMDGWGIEVFLDAATQTEEAKVVSLRF